MAERKVNQTKPVPAGNPNNTPTKGPIVTHLLGIPDTFAVSNPIVHMNSDEYRIRFKRLPARVCTHCGSTNCVIKDGGRDQTIRHTPVGRRGTLLTIHRRRFLCRDCGKTCYEKIDLIHEPLHVTNALFIDIAVDMMEKNSISQISNAKCVSHSIVYSVMNELHFERPTQLPETLCIDEFKGDVRVYDEAKKKTHREKFQCNISNGDTGTVHDVLPDPNTKTVEKYFSQYPTDERERVRFVCCDMRPSFLNVAKKTFPKAVICVDNFHVVRNIEGAVDEIRVNLQNAYSRKGDFDTYKMIKGTGRLLKTKECNQEAYWKQFYQYKLGRLQAALDLSPELKLAYTALQEYHRILAMPVFLEQCDAIHAWTAKYLTASGPLLQAATMVQKHKRYITNSWKYHKSNAVSEGLNNSIKVIKRISYGVRIFETLRSRILLVLGDVKPAHDRYTVFGEKRGNRPLNEPTC